MEGNRLIVIHEPKTMGADAAGQPLEETIDHEVWARRIDRGGSFSLVADAQQGTWATRFDVRKGSLDVRPRPGWSLTDDYGDSYEIEAVTEPPGLTPNHWLIYGTGRT